LFITWRETLSYLTRMVMSSGKTALIIGSGGNGLAFVSHARLLGASHVTLIGSAERKEDAIRAGAHQGFNDRDEQCWAAARECCPDGYDLVIDVVGKSGLAQQGLSLLKPGGSLGIYGLDDAGRITLNPTAAPGTFTFYNGGYAEHESHATVLAAYRSGQLDPSVWLRRDQVFTLDKIAAALEAVKSRTLIKPLIRLT
jgi:threonine dehydrogenase-like Zn-dependent dehydrogenase